MFEQPNLYLLGCILGFISEILSEGCGAPYVTPLRSLCIYSRFLVCLYMVIHQSALWKENISWPSSKLGINCHCIMDRKNGSVVNSPSDYVLFTSVLGMLGYCAVSGVTIPLVCGIGGILNAVLQ